MGLALSPTEFETVILKQQFCLLLPCAGTAQQAESHVDGGNAALYAAQPERAAWLCQQQSSCAASPKHSAVLGIMKSQAAGKSKSGRWMAAIQ